MSELTLDQTGAIATAAAEGLVTERFGDDHLLIDLDTPYAAQRFLDYIDSFEQNLSDFSDGISVVKYMCWNSKSGTGVHVVVELSDELPLPNLLIMQSYLGSDVTRDFLSMMRLWQGQEQPRLLFRPEKQKKKEGQRETFRLVKQLAGKRQVKCQYCTSLNDDDVPF